MNFYLNGHKEFDEKFKNLEKYGLIYYVNLSNYVTR